MRDTRWWAILDLNQWPSRYQHDALTNWANRPTTLIQYRIATKVLASLKSFIERFLIISTNNGGAKEIRTPDPLRARQVLYQLSYGPIIRLYLLNYYQRTQCVLETYFVRYTVNNPFSKKWKGSILVSTDLVKLFNYRNKRLETSP